MSLLKAINFLIDEGSDDSELKKNNLKKWCKKNLSGTAMENLDNEWHFRLALAQLCTGDKHFKGFQLRNIRDGKHPFHFNDWKPYKKTKKLLVIGEQGIGDQVVFANMFPDLMEYCDDITIECDPRLASIFDRSMPGITFHPRKDLSDGDWAKDFTAQVYMGDLFKYFRKGLSYPHSYLTADPIRSQKYKELHQITAVSWRGRQAGLDPRDMVKGEEAVISLQYGEKFHFPEPSINLKDDIEEIFAILANVKRLITVPTSIAHFAGALGVETFLIKPPKGNNHGGFDTSVHNGLDWKFSRGFNHSLSPMYDSIIHPSMTIYESLDVFLREHRGVNNAD